MKRIDLFFWVSAVSVVLSVGCHGVQDGPYYSATAQWQIERGQKFAEAEGRLMAVQNAEKHARDQILTHIMDRTFSNGIMLEEAVITDPFIQAKVYDTLRNAKITDQTVNSEGVVTVTVRLDMGPVLDIVNNKEYAEYLATRVPEMAPRGEAGVPK